MVKFSKIVLFFSLLILGVLLVFFWGKHRSKGNISEEKLNSELLVTFAGTSSLFQKIGRPEARIEAEWKTKAWKGERVNNQVLIWTESFLSNVRIETDDLKGENGSSIPKENIIANFIHYVISNGETARSQRCEVEESGEFQLIADVIGNDTVLDVEANNTQPIWLSIEIPANIPADLYKGTIEIVLEESSKRHQLSYEIEVVDRVLPDPKDWKFHLNLWQNPDAIARVHGVEKWSNEHFVAMEPYMKKLLKAGQKVVTTTLIHDPWNSQTFDIYDSMILWNKNKDGSWSYDYTNFDKYVSFMHSLGGDLQIECFSMIPWNLKFRYYDEILGKEEILVAEPGSAEYQAHWEPMLKDFAAHLKEKGWFDQTTIAMDERPLKAMQEAISTIRSADEGFKISLAGSYHSEIEKELFNYSVEFDQVVDKSVLKERNRKGLITTFYTSCAHEYPNIFTGSSPAESAWLGWYAASAGYDGFLRWAYNSWPETPLEDSRFGSWPSGDTFLVYPGALSSVRFEKLIEGIVDFEKLIILKEEFRRSNNQKGLDRLEEIEKQFTVTALRDLDAEEMVEKAREVLNDNLVSD
jgi:hypothetical protein